ncbi:MAG: ribosomal protein L7/L12 [Candidatus Contendobacter sp.]|nr:ribosomal protein L7/L12 [Candidatus Contendobacter sp.]
MHYDPPSLDDYFSLLEQGVEESAKEQYLRLRACVRQIHFNETPTPKAAVKRFNVVMTSFGVDRTGVIKAIRATIRHYSSPHRAIAAAISIAQIP